MKVLYRIARRWLVQEVAPTERTPVVSVSAVEKHLMTAQRSEAVPRPADRLQTSVHCDSTAEITCTHIHTCTTV